MKHRTGVAILALFVALGVAALLPGSWTAAQTGTAGTPTAVTVTATTVTVNPTATATTTVPLAAGSTLDIPPDANIPPGTTLSLTPLDPTILANNPPPTSVSDTGAPVFVAAAFTIDLSSDVTFTPDNPASFSFTLTPEQIAALDGATPAALFFDEDSQSWVDGGTTCDPPTTPTWDPSTGQLTIAVCHFSDWIVVGEQRADVDPGQVTTPSPADTGMGEATDSGATDTMAILLGVVALAGIVGVGTRLTLARRQA